MKKVYVFDLDGTLTEHRTWITDEKLAMLDSLKERGIRIVISGACDARRIFTQMRKCPVDIIGNYGLQYAVYRDNLADIEFIRDLKLSCGKKTIEDKTAKIRQKYGFESFFGDSVEFNLSGCVTIPLLGTKAAMVDKIAFDPDHVKRYEMLPDLIKSFSKYNVFVTGSTSFDLVPKPYSKYHALDMFCRDGGYSHEDIVYFGDAYEKGGNDEVVLLSDIDFVKVDKNSDLNELVHNYSK